ncbi:DUF1800 domain-containing protein [Tateyamaria omphalii]|uniref:DUF1800 domain-containing protein n=1 Tax=Tateyamaria omphalii TaxID=299262 RepID=UPI001C99AF79|nr:DUF1800 domain-containing protein [Tateyamaria omphalii]MBY5934873.1 DUF1800 domain-containing protein [Tateyamaria omphalii]
MRDFDPQLAEIRFGYGLSPEYAAPTDINTMLSGLTGPDLMAETYPIQDFTAFRARMVEIREQRDIRKKNRGTSLAAAARKRRNEINKEARVDMAVWVGKTMLRRAHTETAFRERIVSFWADHFTAVGKRGVVRRGTSPYIEEAIRPFITGSFDELLVEAVTHPLMVDYLDQRLSTGPNSVRAERAGNNRKIGLNENLAREVLELHTLGVDGPYTQTDVTELAELLTGLTFDERNGMKFQKNLAEPGSETVLGVTYSEAANLKTVRTALEDLAHHPATARHIATKLAIHFGSDRPDPDLIDTIERAFVENRGALLPVYEALLTHPSVWDAELSNVKPPVDFMSSALRALAVPPAAFEGRTEQFMRGLFQRPLFNMGQRWETPNGPDGWPEEDLEWITPQGIALRVSWAMSAPGRLIDPLPDPRDFVDHALGRFATKPVRFAAAAAETRPEAIGLVLMSPAFQRR